MKMSTILVIEDERILREEVAEWLELEGYAAMGAADGEEGIDLALTHSVDMIICDIAMPRRDGYEVIAELRANPRTQAIPFIYVTALAGHDDIRRGMSLGADDYITKPFTRRELLQAVQTRLEKKSFLEQCQRSAIEQWQRAFHREHEQRLLKAKTVAMFSHDFRNPLTSIAVSSDILSRRGARMDEEHRQKYLNYVKSSVHQLTQMLDDMLIVTQMESDSLMFDPEIVNLPRLMEELAQTLRIAAGEQRSITLKLCSF